MAVPRAHRHSSEGESHQVLHKVMAFFILYHVNSLSHLILPVLLLITGLVIFCYDTAPSSLC